MHYWFKVTGLSTTDEIFWKDIYGNWPQTVDNIIFFIHSNWFNFLQLSQIPNLDFISTRCGGNIVTIFTDEMLICCYKYFLKSIYLNAIDETSPTCPSHCATAKRDLMSQILTAESAVPTPNKEPSGWNMAAASSADRSDSLALVRVTPKNP